MQKKSSKRLKIILGLVVVLLVVAEGGARYVLGLGDPPLSIADPQIEYMFKPASTYHRFGNIVSYNKYSMRSEEFPEHKTNPREVRVLLIGDSVVNGGAQTDQSQLATSILEQRLSADLKRPVIVGNVSAGSWGPPNQLAYLKRFGLFDADAVVLVLSSHDYSDVPTFQPIVGVDPDFPDRRPVLALQEAVTRYLPRFLGIQRTPELAISNATNDPRNPSIAMAALRQMIQMIQKSKAKVIVAQHLEQDEIGGKFKPGHVDILRAARQLKVPVCEIGDKFKASIKAGQNPYRDNIHPNILGQKLIADSIEPSLVSALEETANHSQDMSK